MGRTLGITAGPVSITAGPVSITAGPVSITAGPVSITHTPVIHLLHKDFSRFTTINPRNHFSSRRCCVTV
uniref:Uncharacterized protein n=1 Tax=Poecilia reticulata TaxID=8081 RepID=A0A3P9Q084_POERE